MGRASIPVDLFNPGQVFACLGFLEAADILLGDAEGGFDWSDEANVRFLLGAAGNENPFEVVLESLADAEMSCYVPIGYQYPPPKKRGKRSKEVSDDATYRIRLIPTDSFPDLEADRMALPIQIKTDTGKTMSITHWADGSGVNRFKLYAGNRTAYKIALDMKHWLAKLLDKKRPKLISTPYDVLIPMGGSFNFDPRGAWTSIDAGYSPNEHQHAIAASPVVELLASIGLENARPDEYQARQVRYCAWSGLAPPILVRATLGNVSTGISIRKFRFVLNLSGKNKVVTFSNEETRNE